MRYAVLLALCIAITGTEAKADSNQARLELIARRQQALIEKTFGITFAKPVIAYGVPDGMNREFADLQVAWFVPDTGAIVVHPRFEQLVGTMPTDSVIASSMRFELGRAYVNGIAKRYGFTQWPPKVANPPQFMTAGFDSIIGYVMLNEGIGWVFERLDQPCANDCDFDHYVKGANVYLPGSLLEDQWYDGDMLLAIFSEGGYCLVKPVISGHTEAGIEYILTHRFTFPDWDLRTAVRQYVSDALYHFAKTD